MQIPLMIVVFPENLWNRDVTNSNEHIHSPKRRIDDRITELCEKVRTAELDEKELEAIRQELLGLMHDKLNRIRKMAAAHWAGTKDRKTAEPTIHDHAIRIWSV
jgi:hypothetical protein